MQQQLPKTINGLIILMQILAGVTILLIGVMFFLEFNKPKQRYFVYSNPAIASTSATGSDPGATGDNPNTTGDNPITTDSNPNTTSSNSNPTADAPTNQPTTSITKEIFPLEEPNVSTKSLLRWAALAATNAYTLDFVNYEDSLEKLQPFFTKAGLINFRKAMDENNRLNDIIEKKLIVSAVVYAPPVLVTEGNLNGFYSWRIQVPILLSYQGASETSTKQNIVATMLVTRVPTTDAVAGIGITQMQDKVVYE